MSRTIRAVKPSPVAAGRDDRKAVRYAKPKHLRSFMDEWDTESSHSDARNAPYSALFMAGGTHYGTS